MSTITSRPLAGLPTPSSKHLNARTTTLTPPTTPTTLSVTAHALFVEIQHIRQALLSLSSLAPGQKTNTLLTRLVNLCIEPHGHAFVEYFLSIDGAHELCADLRRICAEAEGELERYWVERILGGSEKAGVEQTEQRLRDFPYHQNYTDLSHLETSLLRAFLPPPSTPSGSSTAQPLSIAFIGSGPLPHSSLNLLALFPTAKVTNIDRDASALAQSQELCARLGCADRMGFVCEDATVSKGGWMQWEKLDVVFLAALVGMTSTEKIEILEGLVGSLARGCLVMCRSARGLRGVLYPVLELSDDLARMGYEILAEVHPWTSVVNSVVVLRVR
ncbi:Nicotianamine synthase [Lentithecium fluviatile CBS 122367]|uniref:Nicotianamine synthase n=1 Tax=Lentithecium fluviatile CBS 122367 TaxID=1168545 RepID=A0A6G1IHF8_9PLEO|nr:Nicotianamine synthase [Lentithecium fluviatile CBS 122367]